MLNEKDKEVLAAKGITEQQLNQQLADLRVGFPFLELSAAASLENGGIYAPSPEVRKAYLRAWQDYVADAEHEVVKFVPASGAASRMFKDLFAFLDGENETPDTDFLKCFFEHLPQAAFLQDLDAKLQELHGKCSADLVAKGDFKSVVAALLGTRGLNYGHLPKALLKFHRYEDGSSRTPFEEHLVEGALYAKNAEGKVQLHFTVSPEHRSLFEALATKASQQLGTQYQAQYSISFSEQKSSTDTIAANADGSPFRDAEGALVFRPGGHGALIENLNDIDADIVFVKTVDNVSPDSLKAETVENKQLLAGLLVSLQAKSFEYLEELEEGNVSEERLQEMLHFLEHDLHYQSDTASGLDGLELLDYLYTRLNRPIRVCGMVRNVGEPGGGPFLVYNTDGSISLQILESSQIDMNDAAKKRLFAEGTHFNPVDLVCGLRDFNGEKFHLPDFVDPNTGFISHKSKDGKELLALELPGLWNGAMSDWSTVFVEVPLATFNPVKTVNDLFRPQHQL